MHVKVWFLNRILCDSNSVIVVNGYIVSMALTLTSHPNNTAAAIIVLLGSCKLQVGVIQFSIFDTWKDEHKASKAF